jgi:hypothetical protein
MYIDNIMNVQFIILLANNIYPTMVNKEITLEQVREGSTTVHNRQKNLDTGHSHSSSRPMPAYLTYDYYENDPGPAHHDT